MGVLNGGGIVKRAVTLGIIIVGIVLVLFTVVNNQAKKPIKQSPKLTLQTADGTSHSIGGKSGRWMFVNIWASWCGPCREEAPALVQVAKKLGDEVDFIGVNATSEDTQADAAQFVADYHIPYTILLDPDGKALEAFSIAGYPTSYLINPKGQVVRTFEGPYSEQAFTDAIETELKKG
jgi:cytochrome c biogenesis protein CcmG/thiol:disulfide interchange protein DsbE